MMRGVGAVRGVRGVVVAAAIGRGEGAEDVGGDEDSRGLYEEKGEVVVCVRVFSTELLLVFGIDFVVVFFVRL